MCATLKSAGSPDGPAGQTRRDFVYLTAGAMGAVGAAVAFWPLVDSMNPSAEILALSSTELDLAPIEVGQRITVMWTGRPVFIVHRTADDIRSAEHTSELQSLMRNTYDVLCLK